MRAHFEDKGSIQQLRKLRGLTNRMVLHSIKELQFSEDIRRAMTLPRPLCESDLEQVALTRRLEESPSANCGRQAGVRA